MYSLSILLKCLSLIYKIVRRLYCLNPFLCHFTTVCGLTMRTASRHLPQNLETRTQKSRSLLLSLARFTLRFITANCWRRARFSMARSQVLLSLKSKARKSLISLFIMHRGLGRIKGRCQRLQTAHPFLTLSCQKNLLKDFLLAKYITC